MQLDAVVGMACKIASTCDLSPMILDTLYVIDDGLNEQPEKTISQAKEATVVTLTAFDHDHYTQPDPTSYIKHQQERDSKATGLMDMAIT